MEAPPTTATALQGDDKAHCENRSPLVRRELALLLCPWVLQRGGKPIMQRGPFDILHNLRYDGGGKTIDGIGKLWLAISMALLAFL